MKKEIKAYIESELRNYEYSKKDLEEIKNDIREEGNLIGDSMGIRGSGTSNIVENKAIRLMTNKRIKKLEETIRAIEVVTGELDESKYRLIELKYWKRPNLLTDAGMADQLSVGIATYYRWKEQILKLIGIEMGLIEE